MFNFTNQVKDEKIFDQKYGNNNIYYVLEEDKLDEKDDVIAPFVRKKNHQNCTAHIDSISQFGEIIIKFSTNMKTGFNNSLINATNTDIYVLPAK